MSSSIPKVAILTNIIPSYRKGFYDLLFKSTLFDLTVFCQSEIKGFTHATIHDKFPEHVRLVNYISLKKEKFVWQFLPFLNILKNYDLIFIDGNPRIFSQALFATFLRVINRKVVIWSMVHSSWNNKFTESLRLAWLKVFKYHFVYNDADIVTLKAKGFKNKVIVAMNNGLNQEEIDGISMKWSKDRLNEWQRENSITEKIVIVSCGRLEPNKYDDMMKAMPGLISKFPNILWCIVGDGPDRVKLLEIANHLNVQDHIHFTGAIFDNEELAPWFLSSKMFIHPFAIGLSIMHAFGFGLPVVTHDSIDDHGPEYVAFEDNLTGKAYAKGNILDLTNTIEGLIQDKVNLSKMREYVLVVARTKYNTKIMYQRFVQMVNKANEF